MPDTPENVTATEENPFADAIQKLLKNPEIINTVAAAVGASPLGNQATEITKDSPPTQNISAPNTDSIATLAPVLSSLSSLTKNGAPSKISSNQACLLRALKPYVNSNRCEAIEYIIKITEISQLLKTIN